MPKPKSSQPILKLVPPSPWLQKVVNGIEYWVHTPTRRCGIHIRGLAKLCGVHHTTILGILKKAEGDLVGLRESAIYNLLKNRDIFLKDLVGLSPMINGKAAKVILSDVCTTFIRYYANEERKAAIQSAASLWP